MNDSNTLRLDWKELRHYKQLPEDHCEYAETRSGVYIWGFMDDDKIFWPYYVGRHRDVFYRIAEHLNNLKGGNYTVYDCHNLFSLEDKPVYQSREIKERIGFLTTALDADIHEAIANMISRLYYTWAAFDNYKEWRSKAESTVMHCFSRTVLANKNFGNASREVDAGNLFLRISSCWDNREGVFDREYKDNAAGTEKLKRWLRAGILP